MRIPHLNDLAVFLRVIDHHSFSAAARSLNTSPKTVSKQIARLEQTLATSLFERNTRHIRLTDEGKAIAVQARLAVSALDEIQELTAQGKQTLNGMIRLSATSPFGRKYVAPAIAAFLNIHPEVGFELRLTDQVIDLFSSNLDLAIRIGDLADSRLLTRRLVQNIRIPVASPAYLKRYGTPLTPDDLSRHACLIFTYPGVHQNIWSFSRRGKTKEITVNGTLFSDSGEVLRTWCLAGHGIALREIWDITEELQTGQLIRVLPEWSLPASGINILRPRREPTPQRLTVFIDFLAEQWRNAAWAEHP